MIEKRVFNQQRDATARWPATTLILGGARSGKSRRARTLAESLAPQRTIVVTAEPIDAEMRARIARHQAERDASWQTIESPLHIAEAIVGAMAERPTDGVVLVDCLTVWLSNLMHHDKAVDDACGRLFAVLDTVTLPVVLVSNELGLGLVPETPLGRRFRDEQGFLNQRIAEACARVELVVAGQCLTIRG